MDELLSVNPGLKSRFSERLRFRDFSSPEACQLLLASLVKEHGLVLGQEAGEALPGMMEQVGAGAAGQACLLLRYGHIRIRSVCPVVTDPVMGCLQLCAARLVLAWSCGTPALRTVVYVGTVPACGTVVQHMCCCCHLMPLLATGGNQ